MGQSDYPSNRFDPVWWAFSRSVCSLPTVSGGAGYAMRNEKEEIQMAILAEDESEGEIEDDES